MHLKKYSFDNLLFPEIFKTYVHNFSSLKDFYQTNPFSLKDVKRRAKTFTFDGHRQTSANLLHDFNHRFDVKEKTLINIERLQQDDALAIVTGQQLGLYGGPLYTIYKALTTIALANRYEKELNRPVVPVFWLADEDHDYNEVNTIQVLTRTGLRSFSLSDQHNDLPPVADMPFPDEIHALRESLKSSLIETDFSHDLWPLLDRCFASGQTFREGFGRFIAQLFSKYGLVLAGSNTPALKDALQGVMKQSVEKADVLQQTLEQQSKKMGERFHQQATVYDSHLFYLHPEQGRVKIQREAGGRWHMSGKQWDKEELVEAIETNPEKFSPDVFLRPILQDRLLPTLGYVAGPGEISYYGQMKTFYNGFGQHMPVIFPRMSATIIEPAIHRVMKELPFDFSEYKERMEDLESTYVDRTEKLDIDGLFESWKKEAQAVATSPKQKITAVDETLEGAVEKAQASFLHELNQLKGKVYRAVKKQDKIQLERLQRIHMNLFPERTLQERTLCGIYFMNKFGLDIWDRLLEAMKEDLELHAHQLIYV